MLKYVELKEKPREFLSVTRLTVEEFQALLPTFEKCYQLLSPAKPKLSKKHKGRASGGGRKAKLLEISDKLLFVLAYQKIAPLQTMGKFPQSGEKWGFLPIPPKRTDKESFFSHLSD